MYSIKSIFITIIIFILIVLWIKSRIIHFEGFITNDIFNSSHFLNYMKSIHPNIFQYKLPNLTDYSPQNFYKNYKNNIKIPNASYKKWINKWITNVDQFIPNELKNVFNKYPWKVLISTENLEMNMPFTIHDTIILPEKRIDNWIIDNSNDNIPIDLIDVLIHEKIHIIQRINQNKFNDFYKEYYTFATKYIDKIPIELQKIHMNNPDSNSDLWTYKYKNNDYLPLLVIENNGIKQIGYNIKNNNDKISISNQFIKSNNIKNSYSAYHLNELFSYELSDDIINKNRNQLIYDFMKNL